MRRATGRLVRVMVALALLLASGGAQAATTTGTILTNIVSATLWDGPLLGDYYEVSYNASAYVTVIPPARVELLKRVNVPQSPSGSVVMFTICMVNGGANTSAWGVTITDRLPSYMTFEGMSTAWTGAGSASAYQTATSAPTVTVANGAAPGPAMTAGVPAVGTPPPLYLRWTIQFVGPNRSACVTYFARIL